MPPRHRPLQSSCREPTARFARPRAAKPLPSKLAVPHAGAEGDLVATPPPRVGRRSLTPWPTHANDVMTECGRAPTTLANTCTPDPPWRTLSRGSMRRWRICWFTVGLPSTAFTLHVAVTWNARSVRMRPNGSPNNDRQYWFQRARKVPGGNEVLLTNGLHHGCASDAEAVEFLQCAARPGLCALRERSCGVPAVSARLSR